MKKIFDIIAFAAVFLGLVSGCAINPEDTFSKDAVAPEFYAHSDILMTANTIDEEVNFSWTAARNVPYKVPTYTLSAEYGGTSVQLATTTANYWKCSKSDFREMIYKAFPTIPENSTFSMTFTIAAPDCYLTGEPMTLNIYSYGAAVSPEVSSQYTDLVLDVTTPQAAVNLISWEQARLVYGEQITYSVYIKTAVTRAMDVTDKYLLADGLTDLGYSITVDELNEAVIAAGGAEAAKVPVQIFVAAKCASYQDGILSNPVVVNITTYISTFPDRYYMPGSYQGWDPATAATLSQSTSTKGLFEGIVDLTTASGEDCEFKFSPVPAWEGDFGATVEVTSVAGGDGYYSVKGSVGASSNIKVPSGVYFVVLNKKLNTLLMVQYKSLSMIGAACGDYGWGTDVDMIYDAEAGTFTAVTVLKKGEFKIRLNHDWSFAIGKSLGLTESDDNLENSNEGEFKVVLGVGSHPFSLKYLNTSFPDNIYVPGSHNGWSFGHTPIAGDGNGRYEGFMNIGGEYGFKFTPKGEWGSEWGWDGAAPTVNDKGATVYGLVSEGGKNIMEGTDVLYHKVVVDLTQNTVAVTPVTCVGIVGGFNGWGDDYATLAYDESSDSWKAEGVKIESAKTEWKFRMNGGWDVNLGGDFDNLVDDGANLTCEPGIYTVELFIHTTPFKAVMTKTGDVDAPDLPETMYSIGAEFGGWDWASDGVVEMTPVNGKEGHFWAIRYITGGAPFKFSPKKEWGSDFCSLGAKDAGFTTEGGNCLVAQSGLYMIYVNCAQEKITIEPAVVYGIGGAFGDDSWSGTLESAKFNVNGSKALCSIVADGDLRMYAAFSEGLSDWWTREFVILGGKIAYRGNGGDQERVSVKAGQVVELDFNAGTGGIYEYEIVIE